MNMMRVTLSMSMLLLSACNAREADSESTISMAASSEANKSGATHSKVARRREGKLLQTNEIRVALVVLPGDARVEVDGQVAERREGLVDLEGKVGDVRRVRATKGDKATEKSVTISENGPTPALLDLNAPGPTEPTSATKKKSSLVQFGFDE